MTSFFEINKYQSISMTFKIKISQYYDLSESKHGNEKNQTFFDGIYPNLTSYKFLSKNIEVFQWLSKSKFLSFITKVSPDNQNETKSDIFQ